jgi:polygalacturonase
VAPTAIPPAGAAGTGYATAVNAILQEFRDAMPLAVKTYGAAGDGVTVDTAAFLDLAADCPTSSGVVVLLSPGNYLLDDLMHAFEGISNIALLGDQATVTFSTSAGAGKYLFTLGDFTDTTRQSRIRVAGIKFALNRAPSAGSDQAMLGVRYADDVKVEDVAIPAADVEALYATKCTKLQLARNLIGSTVGGVEQVLGDGIFTNACERMTITKNVVRSRDDCIFHERANDGSHSQDITVTENQILASTIGAGIRTQAVDGLTISDNDVRNTGDVGIDISEEFVGGTYIAGCRNFTITDNVLVDAGQNAGAVGTSRDGINAIGCAYGKIKGNEVRNTYRHGIYAARGSSGEVGEHVSITDNDVVCDADGGHNNGVGILTVDLSRSRVKSNYVFNSAGEGILVQQNSTTDAFGLVVTGNELENIKKVGAGGVIRAVYFVSTSTGHIVDSLFDGNTVMDRRPGPVTNYGWRVDAGNAVQRGPNNIVCNGIALTDLDGKAVSLQARTFFGAPTDGDFAFAPTDGRIVVDVTNARLYARVGGVWKYAALT